MPLNTAIVTLEPLPRSIKIYYALGQLGWSTLYGLISVWLVWFYFPPHNIPLPHLIPQGAILGFFTVIGLITMAGRLFDAITDPWIANLSDKSNHPKGRRISFMAKGAVPFAILTLLIFTPPAANTSIVNVVWLTLTLLAFYLFFTIYITPFTALLAELGRTPAEKLDLSTYISFTWFLGYVIASSAANIWLLFQNAGLELVWAIRATFACLSIFGLICILIPVWLIDEKKYVTSQPTQMKLFEALRAVFQNRNFLYFTISDLAYWTGMTIFQTGTVYYATVLLRLPESWVTTITFLIGILSFCCYSGVNLTAKKIGKKKLMNWAFILLMFAFIYSSFAGYFPFSKELQVYLLVILISLPMAIFGILPNAIVADIAEHDAFKTGANKEAMFFGARTFMSKVGQMLSMVLFSSLLLLGKDIGHDLGVRLTAISAAVLCLIALFFFLKYNEKEILSTQKISQK